MKENLNEQTNNQNRENTTKIEEEKDWTDIHKDFDKKYRQKWEEEGLTYEDTKEWITTGFKVSDFSKVKKWKNNDFSPKETKSWIDSGLESYDYKLAVYLRLRYKVNQPNKDLVKRIRKDGITVQEYLDILYPKNESCKLKGESEVTDNFGKQRKEIKELYIDKKNLTGTLDLSDFTELEWLMCCDNELTDLDLTKCKKLKLLNCINNNFSRDLSLFSHLVNLEWLIISNNLFYGSLEPLKNLSKLKWLEINNTDIDGGLEYLPENIKKFEPLVDKRLESKVKVITREWNYCGGNVKAYRELISQTSQVQEWLDKEYSLEKREEETSLDISDKGLKGGLKLKGFTKLEILLCYNNQLTHLDLSDCTNLKRLWVYDNNLCSLNFLNSVPKLESLLMYNNPNFPKDGLKFIAELKELKTLKIDDCPFEGTMKHLENLSKLERLRITNTNLSEGLEYLPESLKEISCNSNHDYKSYQIVKELEKHLESKESNEQGTLYYNFRKWLKNKRNSVANSVPLEKLYVIRGNLMRFLNKWGTKEDKISEVSKLQDPNEISSYWYIGESGQWISRATAVTGGILAATTNPILGGVLAATSPVLEVCASQLKERIYEAKEKQWNAYSEDLEDLLNSYHELLGIIETIVIGEKGEVNMALKELKNSIEAVLERYDKDNNQMVDIEELKTKEGKAKLAQDLDDKESNQLQRIISAIEEVKFEVINYHRRNEKKELTPLTELENVEIINLEQRIKKEIAETKTKIIKKLEDLEEKKNELGNTYKKIKDKKDEKQEILTYLKNKEKLNDEEKKLSASLEEEIKQLGKKMSDIKEEINNIKKEKTKISSVVQNHPISWWEKSKKILFCGKDKNEPSIKDQLSLDNDEKQKEIQEFIDNQENNQKDTVIHLEENEQGGLTEKENPQEQSSAQAQIQVEPK